MSGLPDHLPPDHLPPAPPEGARELAELLSFATRVEPELIRAVRLRFLPWLDAGAEADLWFSDWVGARTPEAVALLPQCLPHLRAGLVERLRSEPELGEVFEVVEAHHRGLSPALLLEERVTWHTLTGDLEAADRQLDRAPARAGPGGAVRPGGLVRRGVAPSAGRGPVDHHRVEPRPRLPAARPGVRRGGTPAPGPRRHHPHHRLRR